LGLCFKDGRWQSRVNSLIVVVTSLHVVLVLFGVDTKTLGHKINLNSIDVLNQPRDGRQNLLGNVPIAV